MANKPNQVSDQLVTWSELEGKVVLITGASSGFGWDFSINLAKAGCKIIAAARRLDRLETLCNLINKSSSFNTPLAMPLELDISADSSVIEAAVQKAWTAFGHIDVLINNAGIRGSTSTTLQLSNEEWNNVFKINLDGTWLCSKYVASRMRDAGIGGSIINISSIYGVNRVVGVGSLAYSSSKAAMHTLTTVMALEFGIHNIRVNAIAPALFRSEITKELYQKKWLRRVMDKTIPQPFFYDATVDPSLTELIRYLILDSTKYVTGNVFIVDGGHTLAGVPIWSSL
ncbi:3-oxoacyl-[acyl-carrier-protein] reductase, chloroplastic [Heracleum sosnowskyi]|uniref:3-oxoacyl-[acyl-carrier-protein] reductase, chloroplastic n=1 Tax=Heracleum sosnowskyi TaxID=360622 RepID=A0AAD8J4Y2_9APIA|nr:3-oxoacyl-[acyl-carrier-protein] reductase, chloroplastic [Heracleum sosnowskyi]